MAKARGESRWSEHLRWTWRLGGGRAESSSDSGSSSRVRKRVGGRAARKQDAAVDCTNRNVSYIHNYLLLHLYMLLLLCAAVMETTIDRLSSVPPPPAYPFLPACLPSSRCNLSDPGASSPPPCHIRHHCRRFVPVRKDQGICCDEPSTALALSFAHRRRLLPSSLCSDFCITFL